MEELTIFYNKRTGTIKEICGGKQTMDWFGDEKQDYKLIIDYIVVEFDQYIIANLESFNVVDGKLKMTEVSVPKKYN